MTDATLVAGEIQDLATTVGEVAAAIRERGETPVVVNVPEQAPPIVTVNVPEQAPPIVNVAPAATAAPVINVAPAVVQVTPQINVPRSVPNAYAVRITERDASGFIATFIIEPIGG